MDFVVTEEGRTLHRFLIDQLSPHISGKEVKRWLEGQRCTVNGKLERHGSTPLHPGDKVSLSIPTVPKKKVVSVLFENEEFLAIDKWPGLVCENSIIQKYFPGTVLIHRLDKDTTGVLLLAKSEAVKRNFIALFRQKEVKKTYLAICQGTAATSKGIIKDYFYEEGKIQGQTLWSSRKVPPGDIAETQWNVLECQQGFTLMQCNPITGRTHQLRVHLKSLGLPIVGDPLYNKKRVIFAAPRMLLHAWKLSLPRYGIDIEAPIPEDFESAWSGVKRVHH
jgi:23S rRNA pseudouridine955/2504/2580 synthase